jgi:asparagine synthase (glutamine-hydrolysing)
MLVKTDRCGMWNSMEIRSPFMDPEVVAYCNALSEDWKIRQEHQKYVLRKFGETVLPAWMWEGTKKGFEIPLASALPELLSQFAPTRPATDLYRATLHSALHHGHTTLHVRYHILVLMLWMDKHQLAG